MLVTGHIKSRRIVAFECKRVKVRVSHSCKADDDNNHEGLSRVVGSMSIAESCFLYTQKLHGILLSENNKAFVVIVTLET